MQSILALCTPASKVRNKEEPRRARLPLSYTRRSKVLLVRALTLWEQGTAALDTEYMGVNAACTWKLFVFTVKCECEKNKYIYAGLPRARNTNLCGLVSETVVSTHSD